MDKRRRFATLEAMRGVAAIGVVLLHGDALFGAAAPTGGYLAVDFFFLLSGFIMAHVYGVPLQGGMAPASFLRARVVRLYPLYLLGTLATACLAGALAALGKPALWDAAQPTTSLPFAALMLPAPMTDILFPLDPPAWTLFLELVANIAFGLGAWRNRTVLLLTVAISAAVLAASAGSRGSLDVGWSLGTMIPGMARVLFSFPLGVLLYELRHRVRLPAALGVGPVLALGLLLYWPSGALRPLYDLLFVLVASPLLLLAAASVEPARGWVAGSYLFLGAVSYPLYVLHHPTLIVLHGVVERHASPGLPFAAACAGLLGAMLAGARVVAALDRRAGLALLAWSRRCTA